MNSILENYFNTLCCTPVQLVPLSLKVFLEGNTGAGGVMTTTLQNYFGGNVGLLPVTSPYGLPTINYVDINNPTGIAGNITDWIKVEIRLASNSYATAVETQSLLLKPDGTIVTPAGLIPTFNPQVGTVRIVIIHRNHLAVMSNDISVFNTPVTYDFSTALAQASNDFADPQQMKLINGVWTMITGEVITDYSIDGSDASVVTVATNANLSNVYDISDLNLDGFCDSLDASLMTVNFNSGYYSTLINY